MRQSHLGSVATEPIVVTGGWNSVVARVAVASSDSSTAYTFLNDYMNSNQSLLYLSGFLFQSPNLLDLQMHLLAVYKTGFLKLKLM